MNFVCLGRHCRDSRETKFIVPQGDQSLSDLLYSSTKKSRFWKTAQLPATASGHLQLHALITCNSGQHFGELFPVWCHSFHNVAQFVHTWMWYSCTTTTMKIIKHTLQSFIHCSRKSSKNGTVLNSPKVSNGFERGFEGFLEGKPGLWKWTSERVNLLL